jgi:hypothetical protein
MEICMHKTSLGKRITYEIKVYLSFCIQKIVSPMPVFCFVFVPYEGKRLPKSEIPPDNTPDN